jgi:hypothetical protein
MLVTILRTWPILRTSLQLQLLTLKVKPWVRRPKLPNHQRSAHAALDKRATRAVVFWVKSPLPLVLSSRLKRN